MSLEQQIESDLKTAMKSRDQDKVDVLRMVKTAITNLKIEKKTENLPESDVLTVVQKQAKQRRESIDSFQSAGRTELAAKEEKELKILEAYLPKQLSDDELSAIIKQAVADTGAQGKADTGKVMKEVMPKIKGKADGKRVNEILASLLN